MPITWKVQGNAGEDNSLHVRIDTGQAVERLMFDAGEGCVAGMALSDIQSIAHLFFSHLHMDHVAGFDSFFRAVYARTSRPNVIWGPAGCADILQCRFRGFLWNLHDEDAGAWTVREVGADQIESSRYHLREAFAVRHEEGRRPRDTILLDEADYTVEAFTMEHLGPTLAYVVREKPRRNIDTARLQELGLPAGPWLKDLKSVEPRVGSVEIGGAAHDLARLRKELLVETPGESLAYLTDFLLDEAAMATLCPALQGCTTMICESQYRHHDTELAQRNHHMTSVQAAELARQAAVQDLVLIHVSDRYAGEEWNELLNDARAVFPSARFPEHWVIKTHG